MQTNIHFRSYPAQFFLEWEMFQTKVLEKIKTHILCSINFFPRKSCPLWDNVEKYCSVGQATGDSMAHANYMLDNWGYKHTLRICNIYCFSTATVVTPTRLNVAVHVHWSVLSYVRLYSVPLWFYCNKYLKSRTVKIRCLNLSLL